MGEKESIFFDYMAIHFEYQLNKNSLLQSYFFCVFVFAGCLGTFKMGRVEGLSFQCILDQLRLHWKIIEPRV